MSLTQLAPPYPIFTDKNGDPLDAGFIYFGEPNQNPEANPIQVYYDRGFTQPVAQPLRTSNGYIMRNGSPALIYADSQFSVTVRNKRNELVIYSPVGFGVTPGVPFAVFENTARDVTALLADTQFTYAAGVPNTIQIAEGDILRTLAEGFAYEVAASGATDHHVTTAGGVKLYVLRSFDERAFNVESDGTDQSAKLEAYINASAGRREYSSASAIEVNSPFLSLGSIRINPDAASGFAMDFVSPTVTTTTTSAKCFAFNNSVEVSDATGIEPGHVVVIKSATAWPFWTSTFYGHCAIVASVSGSVITFEQPFMMSIETGANVTVYAGGELRLDRTLVKAAVAAAGVNSSCIRVLGYARVEIENTLVENGQSKGLFVAYCANVLIFGGQYRKANAASTGYGIQTWGCNTVLISSIVGYGNRRLVDISGDIPTVAASVRDFKFFGGGAQDDGSEYWPVGDLVDNFGVGTHGGAVSFDVSDGYLCNLAYPINIRSPKTTVKNLTVDGAIGEDIFVLTDGVDFYADGVTHRPFGVGYSQDTIADKNTLLPDNVVNLLSTFASNGGEVSLRNFDVSAGRSFLMAASSANSNKILIDGVSVHFDRPGGGPASLVRGAVGNLTLGRYDISEASGTNAFVGFDTTTLASGAVEQSKGYRLKVANDGASSVKLHTSAIHIVIQVIERSNANIRGLVEIRQGSTLLRDLGTSNLISAASGVLTAGDGVAGNITFSLQGGVIYAANKTGAAVDLILHITTGE